MSHRRTCYPCGRFRGCEQHDPKHTYTEWDSQPSRPGEREWLHNGETVMAMARAKGAGADGVPTLMTDEYLALEYPSLYEFLRETKWDDGHVRKTGAVMVLVESGLLKAWVHDRDAKRSGWVSGDTWAGLWESVELGLATARLEWRADKR